jgi:hypothetical protein
MDSPTPCVLDSPARFGVGAISGVFVMRAEA